MPAIVSTLATTLLVIVVYFWVVRVLDMNEKEPLWAMTLLFVLGGLASLALPVLVPPEVLELRLTPSAVVKELARFGAAGFGIYALTVYGRIRGWQEFNGTMDGVVYGACAGLGFAVAAEVRAEVLFGAVPLPGASTSLFAGFGRIALRGLADGMLGAIVGAGIGAATEARSPVLRAALPVVALGAAVVAHIGYVTLAHGNALGGASGLIRSYIAMGLPVAALALTVLFALSAERAAIRRQLPAEQQAGVITAEELATVQSVLARTRLYWGQLLRGRVTRWSRLRALHNRQVQLALVKDKAARQADPAARLELEQDVDRLRRHVLECRRMVESAGSSGGAAS